MTDASTPNGGHYPDDPALNAAVSKLLTSEPGSKVVARLQGYLDSILGLDDPAPTVTENKKQ